MSLRNKVEKYSRIAGKLREAVAYAEGACEVLDEMSDQEFLHVIAADVDSPPLVSLIRQTREEYCSLAIDMMISLNKLANLIALRAAKIRDMPTVGRERGDHAGDTSSALHDSSHREG